MKKDLQQLFEEFIFECEFARKLKPYTLKCYRHTFTAFKGITSNASLESLSSHTIATFFKVLNERKRIVGRGQIKTGIKKSTTATYWSKLNSFCSWLKINQHIRKNPFESMAYPTPLYEDKQYLRKEQIEKILTAILKNPGGNLLNLKRNLVIFHLLLFCGLRREELLLLQIRDIDLETKLLTVRGETSKVPRTRYLPLHSLLIMYLKDYLRARNKYTCQFLIVSSTKDARFSRDGLKHLVLALKNRSDVNFHLHQLRHTFAVNFLKSSNDIAKLKQLMGHRSISMTLIYLRCLPPHEMRGDIENMSIDNFI